MIYNKQKRNTPIATLIKNYVNKKSGKVVESRDEIQRRFDYLDWKDQKKIMQAFLESGKADRLWTYSKLVDNWDKSFETKIKELWEQLHEERCSWVVTRHFPAKYLSQNIDKFNGERDYYFICLRLAEDKNYVIDKSKLSITDYLSVLYHTERPLPCDVACDLLYNAVCNACTEQNIITPFGRYSVIDKDSIISPILFQEVNLTLYYLRKMGFNYIVHQFETWNEGVQRTIFDSSEYKAVLKAELSEFDRQEAKASIAKKYGYLALDDKYKKADGFSVDDILTPREWFTENPTDERQKKQSESLSPDSTDSVFLEELIAKNPAIQKLVGDFGLDMNNNNDTLPF